MKISLLVMELKGLVANINWKIYCLCSVSKRMCPYLTKFYTDIYNSNMARVFATIKIEAADRDVSRQFNKEVVP